MGKKNFLRKVGRAVGRVAAAPFKEVARVTVKVGKELARTEIIGTHEGETHLLGVPVGKDLVPVVQVGEQLGLSIIVGPTLASGLVTAAHGGNTKQVLNSMLISTASSSLPEVVTQMPTAETQLMTKVVGETCIGIASGKDLKTSVVGAMASIPGVVEPSLEVKVVFGVVGGSVMGSLQDHDNPFRSGLQMGAGVAMQHVVSEILEQRNPKRFSDESKEDGKSVVDDILEPEPKTQQQSLMKDDVKSDMQVIESDMQVISPLNEPKWVSKSNKLSVKKIGMDFSTEIALTVPSSESVAVRYAPKSVGLVSKEAQYHETAHLLSVKGGIYENDLVYEKQDIFSSSNEPVMVQSLVKQVTLNEFKTGCYSNRVVESHYTSNTPSSSGNPITSTVISNQHHLNVDCPKNVAKVAVVVASGVMLPGSTRLVVPLLEAVK
jgi:hypothetical protein